MTARKRVYRGRFLNFKTLLLMRNIMDMVRILQTLLKLYSIFLPKVVEFVLFILVLNVCVIIQRFAMLFLGTGVSKLKYMY